MSDCILCSHVKCKPIRCDESSGIASELQSDIESELQIMLSHFNLMALQGESAGRNASHCILCDYNNFWGQGQKDSVPSQIKILTSLLRVLDERQQYVLQDSERGNVPRREQHHMEQNELTYCEEKEDWRWRLYLDDLIMKHTREEAKSQEEIRQERFFWQWLRGRRRRGAREWGCFEKYP